MPLYRIFTDASGKKTPTQAGNKYYAVLVDDYSRKVWIILSAGKSEIPEKTIAKLKILQSERPQYKIAFIRFDGAGEYLQECFKKAVAQLGIDIEKSAPYRQDQNGVAESTVGKVWKMAKTMMTQSSVDHPRQDWGYAVLQAEIIINDLPTKANNGRSPNSLWGDNRSRLSIPAPLFSECYAKIYINSKMDPEAVRCIYMGNAHNYKAYLVRPIEEGKGHEVRASRDVHFFPSNFPYRHPLVQRPISRHEPQEDNEEDAGSEGEIKQPSAIEPDPSAIEPDQLQVGDKLYVIDKESKDDEPRIYKVKVDAIKDDGVWVQFKGSKIAYGPYKDGYDIFRTRKLANEEMKEADVVYQAIPQEDQDKITEAIDTDPSNRREMLQHPNKKGYIEGEKEEMANLYKQKAWKLVLREPGMNVIKNRWVYKAKREPITRRIYRFRSRITACGYGERYGFEYTDIFADIT